GPRRADGIRGSRVDRERVRAMVPNWRPCGGRVELAAETELRRDRGNRRFDAGRRAAAGDGAGELGRAAVQRRQLPRGRVSLLRMGRRLAGPLLSRHAGDAVAHRLRLARRAADPDVAHGLGGGAARGAAVAPRAAPPVRPVRALRLRPPRHARPLPRVRHGGGKFGSPRRTPGL
ncbi:MAG: hypothetical protein AVDCRST_MAG69-1064, partial [uncultured Solirubrobacteraceae bacterium]